MNRTEAAAIMTAELAKYELLGYAELASMIDAPKITTEVVGPSGARYFVDVRAWWDDKPQGDVRVRCNVDDGGMSAILPLTGDFLKELGRDRSALSMPLRSGKEPLETDMEPAAQAIGRWLKRRTPIQLLALLALMLLLLCVLAIWDVWRLWGILRPWLGG